MLPLLAALGTSLTYGVSNFFAGLASRRAALAGVVLVSQVAALLVGLPFALWLGGALPGAVAGGAAVLAGVGQALALGAFYRALAIGSVSIVAPIGAVGVVLPVLAGVVAGDSVGVLQVVGMALCVAGIAVAARRPQARADAPAGAAAAGRRSVLLASLAAACFGLQFIALSRASEDGVLWPITFARAASVLVIVVAVIVVRPALVTDRRALPLCAFVGVLNHTASGLFVLASAAGGLLSVVSVLSSLHPAVTVVLALLLLGERLSRTQAFGVTAALVGVVMLAGG